MQASRFSDRMYTESVVDLPLRAVRHATVNSDQVIDLKPRETFGDRLRRFFTFQRNPSLVLVDQRLTALANLMRSRGSPQYQALVSEIRSHKYSGAHRLFINVNMLHLIISKNNPNGFFQQLALRVVNAVRQLLRKEPISIPNYELPAQQDFHELKRVLWNDIFALSEKEMQQTAGCLTWHQGTIENGQMAPFNAESLYKMQKELGYRELYFTYADHTFYLNCDSQTKKFSLSFVSTIPDELPASTPIGRSEQISVAALTFGDIDKSETHTLEARRIDRKGKDYKVSRPYPSKPIELPFGTKIEVKIQGKNELPFSFTLGKAE